MKKYFAIYIIFFFLPHAKLGAGEIKFLRSPGKSVALSPNQYAQVLHELINTAHENSIDSRSNEDSLPFLELTEKIYGFDVFITTKIGPIFNAHFQSGMRFGFTKNEE